MRKVLIDNFKLGEEVLVTNYNPPIKAKIVDMYMIPQKMYPFYSSEIVTKYGDEVPVIEVVMDGKIRSFVKDLIKKI